MHLQIGLAIAATLLAAPALAQQEAAGEAARATGNVAAGRAEDDTGVLLGFRHINSLADLPPELELVARFKVVAPYDDHSGSLVQIWERELWNGLQRHSLTQVSASLGPKYGFSTRQMHALALARLRSDFLADRNFSSDSPVLQSFREQVLAVVASSGRNPLALGVSAAILNDLHECAAEDFDRLLEGSADRKTEGWLIAGTTQCGAHFARLAATEPALAWPSAINMLSQGELTQADSIALAWSLAQPEILAKIDSQSRQRFQIAMLAISLSRLFGIGLGDLALERFKGLAPNLQTAVLALDREEAWTALFDGVPVQIRSYASSDRLHRNLAAASILTGREDEALAFAPPSSISAETRRAFACAIDVGRSERQRCRVSYPRPSKFPLVLERLFGRSQTDPYLFAEALFSSGTGSDMSYGEVKVTCRLLAAERFAKLCRDEIAQSLGQTDPAQERWQRRGKPGLAGIPTLAADPALREASARLAAQQRELVARDAADLLANASSRGTVLPAPGSFAELALPESVRGVTPLPGVWPSDAGPLPQGFMPVRFERKGTVAVAVSISATLDPTGEISQGGYWVHRSSDGGRTWDAPLYTGLAQFFPYVVPDIARLPLIAGDGIDLEVEVREIDTASITYPPVGLRSRRIARDLYFHIPFADLERDSDGDGLNDLAARHLLLDPIVGDMPRASVVGGPGAPPCRTGSTESAALSQILTELFGIEARAVVEPIDAPNDLAARLTAWRSSASSGRGPIFLQGDPAHFACLRADRMMIVYDAAAMRAMSQFSPDFRPIAIPSVVMNADETRGFVVYSLGWRGGTLRLLRHGNTWQTETLEDWIT